MSSAKGNSVQITEVVDALRQLGGEATLEQIKKRVTENRGGNPYDNFCVWWNEIQSVIENHSRGLVAPRFAKGPPMLYLSGMAPSKREKAF